MIRYLIVKKKKKCTILLTTLFRNGRSRRNTFVIFCCTVFEREHCANLYKKLFDVHGEVSELIRIDLLNFTADENIKSFLERLSFVEKEKNFEANDKNNRTK